MRTICITYAISGDDCDGAAGVFTSPNQDRDANITHSSISDSNTTVDFTVLKGSYVLRNLLRIKNTKPSKLYQYRLSPLQHVGKSKA